MPSIKEIPFNPSMQGLSRLQSDVVFASPGGVPLLCSIFTPWCEDPARRWPAIVFLQGSAWMTPDRYYELPQLARYADAGYVVMSITHRNCKEGHPWPAFLQDAKTAIRYLRANAEKYRVDPERIGFWGTSSGGTTAMLVQLTADDPAFRTEDYPDQSDRVTCCVECFGPTDMARVLQDFRAARPVSTTRAKRADRLDAVFAHLSRGMDERETARSMSPFYRICDGMPYPPILMLGGDDDDLVDYQTQTLRMYERYLAAGTAAQLIRVAGGPHEGAFWSRAVHDEILKFWQTHL